jgi:hypothetical protein
VRRLGLVGRGVESVGELEKAGGGGGETTEQKRKPFDAEKPCRVDTGEGTTQSEGMTSKKCVTSHEPDRIIRCFDET